MKQAAGAFFNVFNLGLLHHANKENIGCHHPQSIFLFLILHNPTVALGLNIIFM